MTELYGRLIEHLSTTYINVADSPEMRRILELCLTEEEARLLLCVGHPPALHGAKHLGRKAGMKPARAQALLAGMADRGFIARSTVLGRELYALLAIVPGFYELTFMKPNTYPEVKEELRELWTRYKKAHLMREFGDYPTPSMRVVPVHAEIPVGHRVYRRDDVMHIIERAGTLALGTCACRECSHGCDRPDDVCMMFDEIGDVVIEGGFARRATVAEMKDALHRSEEAGLVHCAMNCEHRVQIMCQCCGCCCSILGGLVQLQKQGAVAVSGFEAQVDPSLCTGCGDCHELCWPKAIGEQGDHSAVSSALCFGCGLCAPQCHVGAISLVPRRSPPRPAPHNPLSLTYRMASERGKARAMAKALLEEIR